MPPASPVAPPSPPPPQPVSPVVNSTLPVTYATFASLLSNPFSFTGQHETWSALHPVAPDVASGIPNDFIIPTSSFPRSCLPSVPTRPISTSPGAEPPHLSQPETPLATAPPDVAYSSRDLSSSFAEPPIVDVPTFSGTSMHDTARTLSELGFELPRQEPPDVMAPQFSHTQGHSLFQVECSSALPNLMSFDNDVSPSSYVEERLESEFVDRLTISHQPAESDVLPPSASGDVVDHRSLPQPHRLDIPNSDHEDVNDDALECDIQSDENDNTLGNAQSCESQHCSLYKLFC